MLIGADTWAKHEGDAPREGRCTIWGLDLGQSRKRWRRARHSGRQRVGSKRSRAFRPLPSLAKRGLQDGVGALYSRMADRGELDRRPAGRLCDIAALLRAAWERYGAPVAIAADRWRVKELADILNRIGLPRCPLHERGQGYKDGGEDVRDFRRAMVEGKVRPAPSLLLTAAMGEARDHRRPEPEIWKLAKSTQGGRRRRRAKDDSAARLQFWPWRSGSAPGRLRRGAGATGAQPEPPPSTSPRRPVGAGAAGHPPARRLAVRSVRTLRQRSRPRAPARKGRRPVGYGEPASLVPDLSCRKDAGGESATLDPGGVRLAGTCAINDVIYRFTRNDRFHR